MLQSLAGLSQLQSLELRFDDSAWEHCRVADLQCMAGLQNLEVGILLKSC